MKWLMVGKSNKWKDPPMVEEPNEATRNFRGRMRELRGILVEEFLQKKIA
jgi:hypothetical protein